MQNLVFRFIYGFILKIFLKIFVGVKFGNSKFLVNEKQFIIIANHNSHLDTMSIMASLPGSIRNKVRPVAAEDHFAKTKFKRWMSNYFVNTLLIQRKRDKEHPANDPINKMVKALDEGYSLIIFPEGTRGEAEVQQPFKPGVSLVLLQRPNVKYVPCFLKGMGKAMPKNDNLIIPFTSSLTYGAPQLIKPDATPESILTQMEFEINTLKESNLPKR